MILQDRILKLKIVNTTSTYTSNIIWSYLGIYVCNKVKKDHDFEGNGEWYMGEF